MKNGFKISNLKTVGMIFAIKEKNIPVQNSHFPFISKRLNRTAVNHLVFKNTITAWVRAGLCKLQKRCTRLAAASDKVYQLFAHGRWFSPGTRASSNTKTGHQDIVESGVKTTKINQINL